ncbi:hypothetical protein [Roseibium sediminis]|uniref:hypothetical protein n=1 Tax=Roseibium sediminis TaxID=1775174 RepID=UPI001375AE34|nr:hypothetical protein [Roseibium sediminis]
MKPKKDDSASADQQPDVPAVSPRDGDLESGHRPIREIVKANNKCFAATMKTLGK